MAKYNWTIYDIEERLQKLYVLLKKEKDPKKIEIIQFDIEKIKEKLENYFDFEIYNQEKLLTEYGNLKDDYKQLDFLKPDFIEFNRIASDLIIAPTPTKTSLSKRDILDLTHDFYKSLNRFFFGNFMKSYSRRNDHIIFNNDSEKYRGETTNVLSLKESFIEINRGNNLSDVIATIHEYMHSISALINPYHFISNKWLFSELDPLFIELIAADYLENIFKNNNAPILKTFTHMERVSDVTDLVDTFKLINFEDSLTSKFSNNKQLKTGAKLACDLKGKELEDIIYQIDLQPETYVISYIFAIELYDLYKQDKEKALFTLRKIIELKCNTLEDYYKEIKKLQLLPNQHMLAYHRELQSDINKLIRIKEKNQKIY